jgi:hypothetical protein
VNTLAKDAVHPTGSVYKHACTDESKAALIIAYKAPPIIDLAEKN